MLIFLQYLFVPSLCLLINYLMVIISHETERKNWKIYYSFEFSKNVISKFSGRLLIGQYDCLDVLLLDDIFLQFKKDRNDPDQYFLVLI